MSKDIDIVGAGPAGLTSAIILKREGYNPTVYEMESTFGTDPSWHPSVHATPVNLKALEEYTGIDFSSQFHECDVSKNLLRYWNTELKPADPDEHRSWLVERGQRESSLDAFLYHMAVDMGIEVKFNVKWTAEDFKNAKPNTIVATGLGQNAYEALGVRFTPFYGYWFSRECDSDLVEAGEFRGDFTNEYAYYSAVNGLWYCLLFAKGDISQEALEKFDQIIYEVKGFKPEEWKRFAGATVRYPKLYDGNLIFTGTAAGLIEPAAGFGITASLISGRIAATAVMDKEKAQAEYDRFIQKIGGNVMLKFKEGANYQPNIFMDVENDLWFDIPTIRSDMPDWKARELQEG